MNILLLQLKRIGDLILPTPVISAIREKFPTARLTLVVAAETAPLLPALADVDQTLVIRRGLGDLRTFIKVRRQKFDYCIDLTGNDRSAFLTWRSGADKRIASEWTRQQSKFREKVYNEAVADRVGDLHTIDFHLTFLQPLGIQDAQREIKLNLPASAREKANEVRGAHKIDNPFVIFHPGSARIEKFWDAQRWANVIEHARSALRLNPVLTSGRSAMEQRHAAEIKRQFSKEIVDLTGQLDLLTLAALIEQAQFLVTVDSAPMHLAAATKTPQVVLFGPTNPFHWRPRDSRALILQGRSTAPAAEFSSKQARVPMNDISTEAVINAMNALLSAPATKAS